MKVAVFGAGSLGLTYGSFLSKVCDCTILTRRPDQADAINNNGVVVSKGDESTHAQPFASADADTLADRDVIFVLTKAYDAHAAAEAIEVHAPRAIIIAMQSGIGSLGQFNARCGDERVLAGISYVGAKRTSDYRVTIGENLRTVLGEQDGVESQRIKELQNLLDSAGFMTQISPDVDQLIWEKMIVIVAQQALSALTGNTFGELRRSRETMSIIEPLLAELEAVARVSGVTYNESLIERVHANWDTLPNHRSSMWLDLQTPGNQTEIDYINGAVVRIGAAHGIPTPANTLMHSLVSLAQRASI